MNQQDYLDAFTEGSPSDVWTQQEVYEYVRKVVAAGEDDRAALVSRLEAAQEALRLAEWGSFDGEPECPVCRGVQPTHYPTCALAAVLVGTAERQDALALSREEIGLAIDGVACLLRRDPAYGALLRKLQDVYKAGTAEPPAKPEPEETKT